MKKVSEMMKEMGMDMTEDESLPDSGGLLIIGAHMPPPKNEPPKNDKTPE